MNLNEEKLAEIVALADKATHGPWEHDIKEFGGPIDFVFAGTRKMVAQLTSKGAADDAKFIAAMDPETAKALVEEIRGLRAQFTGMTNTVENLRSDLSQTHAQVAEVARLLDPEVCPDAWGLHEAAKKVLAERNDAIAKVEALGLLAQKVRDETLEEAASAITERMALTTDVAWGMALEEAHDAVLGRKKS